MRSWPLSVSNSISRLQAGAFKLWTASLHHVSVIPVPQLAPESAATLRTIFQTSGFSASSKPDFPAGNPALATLMRLFVRAEAVTASEAAQAFSPLKLDELVHSALLHQNGQWVQSLLQAQSYRGLIFFSDFHYHEHAEDCVLPVGPSGVHLAEMTIRKPFRSALDLGCGCGIQTLLAAQHCAQVTATDINPRALAITRLNADLNGMSNIETLEGSYLEPVAGRQFDLILANPPYVITPEKRMIYRDSQGDAYLYQLIREIPAHLTEGGYAQLISNWVYGKEEPWWAPLETALDEVDVDAWLIHTGFWVSEEYANWWLSRDSQFKNDKRKFEKTKKAWLEWFRDQGIERIAMGDIQLRRRTSRQCYVCSTNVTRFLDSPAGDQLVRLFEALDFLAALPDKEALEETVLIPVEMDILPGEDGMSLKAAATKGFIIQAHLSPLAVEVIGVLDGRTCLRDAIQKAGRGISDDPALLNEIQDLLRLGMLAPCPAN